jgi:hypothetical protein
MKQISNVVFAKETLNGALHLQTPTTVRTNHLLCRVSEMIKEEA